METFGDRVHITEQEYKFSFDRSFTYDNTAVRRFSYFKITLMHRLGDQYIQERVVGGEHVRKAAYYITSGL